MNVYKAGLGIRECGINLDRKGVRLSWVELNGGGVVVYKVGWY